MRPIKLRAWHKPRNEMFEVTMLMWSAASPGTWDKIEVFRLDGKSGFTRMAHGNDAILNNYEFMQFTGLLDKNGREIYEGDVLGVNDPGDRSRAVVVFHEGAFKPQLCVQWATPIFDNDWDDWEVIGNIYENPELC